MSRFLADRVLFVTVVAGIAALMLIFGLYLMYRAFRSRRHRGVHEGKSVQPQMRHRLEDVPLRHMSTTRISPGQVARARAMVQKRALAPDWRDEMALERLTEPEGNDDGEGWGTADE